jgi:sensor c-di-GMP phosphodiesterase-like protein
MRYKTVPFMAVGSTPDARLAAKQMQAEIDTHAKEGWTYVETASITMVVRPGCLEVLCTLGLALLRGTVYATCDVFVFSRDD